MSHAAQKMKLPSSFDGITLKPCGMLPTWKSNKKSSAEIRASPIFPQCGHLTTSSQQSRAISGMRMDRRSFQATNDRLAAQADSVSGLKLTLCEHGSRSATAFRECGDGSCDLATTNNRRLYS